VKLFAWQCGEVIATGSEVLPCVIAIPFLFRAISEWASEFFPIKGNYAPQLGLLYIVRWHKYNNP
jgi:hypothetical protein